MVCSDLILTSLKGQLFRNQMSTGLPTSHSDLKLTLPCEDQSDSLVNSRFWQIWDSVPVPSDSCLAPGVQANNINLSDPHTVALKGR